MGRNEIGIDETDETKTRTYRLNPYIYRTKANRRPTTQWNEKEHSANSAPFP